MSQWERFKKHQNFINGSWTDAVDGDVAEVFDPGTGHSIGTVPNSKGHEARVAIESAATAFESFSRTTAAERSGLLSDLSQAILDNKDSLAELLTREQGKPLAESLGEVGMSAAYVKWFAEETRRTYGDVIPSPWKDSQLFVTKEPLGVVAAITPWNFPSSMLARKIAPALAAGCTIVAKPAMQTPYSGLAWGALAEQVGIPKGVINILTGDARSIGAEFTGNPAVRKVTFTGSTGIGKLLMAQSASTVKKVSLELGGNAPFIIFDDADVDLAVADAIASKFRNAGQTCVCTNRFYAQSGIHDLFIKKLADAVAKLSIGHGLESGVNIGPLIDSAAVRKTALFVDDAIQKGGKVIVGGEVQSSNGLFFKPTVISGAQDDMMFTHEEIFGPIAPVYQFETEAEVVARANATEYGLAAYCYTRDLGRAMRMSRSLEYGMVGINRGVITTEVAPFGGTKQSGVGHEGSYYGIQDYLTTKYTCLAGLGY